MAECYKDKWTPYREQCPETDVKPSRDGGVVTGNVSDNWTWCAKHHPRNRMKRNATKEDP